MSSSKESRWSKAALAVSGLIGLLALIAACVHLSKQLHADEDQHIDQWTPLALAIMSALKMPHSISIRDYTMLLFQSVNVLTWGSIAVIVWVTQSGRRARARLVIEGEINVRQQRDRDS